MREKTRKTKGRKPSNRKAFGDSNKAAIKWLHVRGFRDVILATHCRHHDMWYNPGKIERCMDYWNHWDGMCFDSEGNLWFIQIKTSNWPSDEFLLNWISKHKNIRAITIRSQPHMQARFYYNI